MPKKRIRILNLLTRKAAEVHDDINHDIIDPSPDTKAYVEDCLMFTYPVEHRQITDRMYRLARLLKQQTDKNIAIEVPGFALSALMVMLKGSGVTLYAPWYYEKTMTVIDRDKVPVGNEALVHLMGISEIA